MMALVLCFFFRKAPSIIIVPAALYQNATQITCVNTLRIYCTKSLFKAFNLQTSNLQAG